MPRAEAIPVQLGPSVSLGPTYAGPILPIPSRFGGVTIAAVALSIVTLVLVIFAAVLPWWHFQAQVTGFGTTLVVAEFNTGSFCASMSEGFNDSISSCFPYSSLLASSPETKPIVDVFGALNLLVLLSLVFAILTLVFVLVGIFVPKLALLAGIFGLAGAPLAILAPIYLFFALPAAMEINSGGFSGGSLFSGGFFGAQTTPGVTASWGGGPGWYLGLVAGGLYLITAVLPFSMARKLQPLGTMRLAPPQPPVIVLQGATPYSQPMAGWSPVGRNCVRCGATGITGAPFCPRCGAAV